MDPRHFLYGVPIHTNYQAIPGSISSQHSTEEKVSAFVQANEVHQRNNSNGFNPQHYQQQIVSCIRRYTMFGPMLVVHGMGTGKTATATLASEANLRDGYDGVLIIVPSENHIDPFIKEILKITGSKYLTEAGKVDYAKIYKYYEFRSIQSMTNNIMGLGAQKVAEEEILLAISKYNNYMIVIDEAHNLRTQLKEQFDKALTMVHMLIHRTYNTKVLLMTGTPMKDRWDELAVLVNLLVPLHKQVDITQFNEQFYNDGTNIRNERMLHDLLVGYVSVYDAIENPIPKYFIYRNPETKKLVGSPNIAFYECPMQEMQLEAYVNLVTSQSGEIDEHNALTHKFTQACNFVFPNGGYDKASYEHYTTQTNANLLYNPFNQEMIYFLSYGITQAHTVQQRRSILLRNVAKISSKYAEICKIILRQRGKGLCFVYNKYLHSGGLYPLCNILELLGYTRSENGMDKTPGDRFLVLSSEGMKKLHDHAFEEVINHDSNVKGEYIQVILGSDSISEGYTFKNVQSIMITTPSWNFCTIDQIVGRGIRFCSHDALLKVFPKTVVDVYYMVATAPGLQTADQKMYQRCLEKNQYLDRGYAFLRSVSIETLRQAPVDPSLVSMFEGYAMNGNFDHVFSTLSSLLSVRNKISLEECMQVLPDVEMYEIVSNVLRIVDENIPISNSNGTQCFLRTDGDIYYLVEPTDEGVSHLVSHYNAHLSLYQKRSIEQIKTEMQSLHHISDISHYLSDTDETLLQSQFELLDNANKELVISNIIRLLSLQQPLTPFLEKIYYKYLSAITELIDVDVPCGECVISINHDAPLQLYCMPENGIYEHWTFVNIKHRLLVSNARRFRQVEQNSRYYAIFNTMIDDTKANNYWINHKFVPTANKSNTKDTNKGTKCGTGWLTKATTVKIAYELGVFTRPCYTCVPTAKEPCRCKVMQRPTREEIKILLREYSFEINPSHPQEPPLYHPNNHLFIRPKTSIEDRDAYYGADSLEEEEVDYYRLWNLHLCKSDALAIYIRDFLIAGNHYFYTNISDMKKFNGILVVSV